MAALWFLSGTFTTLTVLAVLARARASRENAAAWPRVATPWIVASAIAMLGSSAAGLYVGAPGPRATAARDFSSAARMLDAPAPPSPVAAGAASEGSPGQGAAAAGNAGSMESAIASLEARLAKGGGSADDWELLAKSYEFLGRPEDARLARSRKLPPLPSAVGSPDVASTIGIGPGSAPPKNDAAKAARIEGEVDLAASLKERVKAGDVLYVIAKAAGEPGPPVAVLRTTVGTWPLKFTLDDSQAMMPGRTLSTTARVTVEARISHKGQPLAAPGDLSGSVPGVDPASGRPLRITIDRVIS